MSKNMLYTDLSGYYDLMCADIDYQAQSSGIHRLHKIFGDGGHTHLDLACGTGPHVRNFIDFGYQSSGLDINQPMLSRAAMRCPEAQFYLQDMSCFKASESFDLITCFLYSIHYNANLKKLKQCLTSIHQALKINGVFCFNVVDKNKINNKSLAKYTTKQGETIFNFSSGWNYSGLGENQLLKVNIEKITAIETLQWQDEHPMVAFSFYELIEILKPYFEIHVFEHDYEKIIPWNNTSGNAIFTCIKI